jgi:hypothetical protein
MTDEIVVCSNPTSRGAHRSPMGKVPAIRHGNAVVTESVAITPPKEARLLWGQNRGDGALERAVAGPGHIAALMPKQE